MKENKQDAVQNAESQYEKMTTAPIGPLILKLAVPTVITMLVTQVYNMADTAFVGQLGNSASAAVGVVFGFMAILQAVGFLFGAGAGSLLSQRLGARDLEGAHKTASTGFFMSLFISILVGILGLIFLDPLVYALGSTVTIAPYAKIYIRYILIAAPFIVPSFAMNNLLRYEGKAVFGMAGMMAGACLNIIGDPIFIFGLKMGIAGAGLSTLLSQIVGFLVLLSAFLRGKTESRICWKMLTLKKGMVGNIVGVGMPSMLRQSLGSAATVALNLEAAVYGDPAVAAMSIVSRVSFFLFSVIIGIGQGYQPVSGFNYGAGKYSRIRQGYRFTFITEQITIIVICLVGLFFSGNVIQFFRDDPEVILIGTRALRLQLVTLMFVPVTTCTEMQLQSTGQKLYSSLLASFRSGLIFIPALLILARVRGLSGIQEAQPTAYILVMIPAIYYAWSFFIKLPREDKEG
ncbi:MAG: MATE family efflux transporter [Lachnospiraceae bacterium]|nr:MATE family efflux transporter [Lachnospiraceae bacterium]